MKSTTLDLIFILSSPSNFSHRTCKFDFSTCKCYYYLKEGTKMGKVFTEKLKMKEGTDSNLQSYANLYRVIYNTTLKVQLVCMDYSSTKSYDDQFMSYEVVLNCIRNRCGINEESTKVLKEDFLNLTKFCSNKKFDEGIETAAIRKATTAFHSWWKKYLESFPNPSRYSKPRFIDNLRNNPYFYTDTEITSTKRGSLYISKIGRIRIAELGCIPDGKYKNAQFRKAGKTWIVRLESIDRTDETGKKNKELPLVDLLEVTFFSDGSLQIGESDIIPSILDCEGYQEALSEVTRYEKIHAKNVQDKKASYTKKLKSRNKLNFLRNKLKSDLRVVFSTIANNIVKARPAKIEMIAYGNEEVLQNFKTGKHRNAKTLLLARIIKKKAELNDIEVVLRGINPSIFSLEKV